ncbi:DUF2169 domain-containing protein [Paracidovorax valerianellae]|uniref:DUF2169 domain-containing protein n=1 Tax=Paracidovorax valerianellae TaxID=187868 RepID=UPI00230261F4|nr:DUF2169 domain-containing protein [Paracidovorax valerianellae]MDA8443917.1 DUF2169 domain-containing protein [Paracidovorax valerianellae]
MADLFNLTPFAAAVYPHVDDQGLTARLLVVKGIWELDRADRLADGPGMLGLHDRALALPIGELDLEPAQREALGERAAQEIDWMPSDAVPPKPRFDLIVSGYAHAAAGKAEHRFMAAVAHGAQIVGLTLCAPRFWRKTLLQGGGGMPGDYLAAVRRVPVHPCFAFGGESHGGETLYNPQGMGSAAGHSGAAIERVALPWVEHPDHPVTDLTRYPMAAGFGPWPENAAFRLPHMGTRDLPWQRERAPRRPQDFHPLFHNQAEPRLQWSRAPAPGDTIALHQFTPEGLTRVIWPSVRPQATVGRQSALPLVADTCVVAPQEGRFAIVWRGLLPPSGAITVRASNA